MKKEIGFELNGLAVTAEVSPHARLIDVLRDHLGHTGTKEACGEGECGACTVMVDGQAINSCLYPAPEIEGKKVLTIEGVATGGIEMSTVQRAFTRNGGVQCGFCSPGMIMSTLALLGENPTPTEGEIRDALTGNLCRCTGYVQIIDSIKRAAVDAAAGDAAGSEQS